MPKKAAGLTAAKVNTAKPGRYVDGDGLMLFVRSPDARFWLLRYSHGGKRREAGLGRAGKGKGAVKLAEARQKAADMRRMLKTGIDPLAHREAEAARQKAAAQQAAAQGVTFRAVADLYMGAHDAGWRNPKHQDQWRSTLTSYAFPLLRRFAGGRRGDRARHGGPGTDLDREARDGNAGAGPHRVGLTMRRRAAGDRERTRRGGAGTWRTCLPARGKVARVDTMPPCRGARWAPSWRRWASARRAVWPRWRCASPS